MNRTNRTSVIRRSGVKAGVQALPDHRATNIRGGMGHKSAGGCSTAIFLILLCFRSLSTTTRPDRADTEEKGKTEATPPFLPLYRQTRLGFGAGFVTWFGAYPAPPYGGRFRLIYPCGKAPNIPSPRTRDFTGPLLDVKGPQAASRPVTSAGQGRKALLLRGDVFLMRGFHYTRRECRKSRLRSSPPCSRRMILSMGFKLSSVVFTDTYGFFHGIPKVLGNPFIALLTIHPPGVIALHNR